MASAAVALSRVRRADGPTRNLPLRATAPGRAFPIEPSLRLPKEGDQVCRCSNDNGRRRPFLMRGSGSDRLPPEYWQTRADKVRAIADEVFDLRSRETLLRIA